MVNRKDDTLQALSNERWVALFASLVFCTVLFIGYYLLVNGGAFLGSVVGIVMALLAWFLAKTIGSNEGGIRASLPYFFFLLLISATGVMNAAFLNLEGKTVFNETIVNSQNAFGQVANRSLRRLADSGAIANQARVEALADALVKEIDNPLNCGQGPTARQIMQELGGLLPGFKPLSGEISCKDNAAVIASYRDRIAGLTERAPWNNSDLWDVVGKARADKQKLQRLEAEAGAGNAFTLMSTIKPALKDIDVSYRDKLERLERNGGNVEGLPSTLPLAEVNSLGEWSQLVELIGRRLGKPSTYIYIFLAIGADALMVYLFGRVRRARNAVPGGATVKTATMGRAW